MSLLTVPGHDRDRRGDGRQLVAGAVQVLFVGDDRLAEGVRLVFKAGMTWGSGIAYQT